MQVFGEWAQVELVELVNDGSGLAFGIVGGRSSGVIVKSVLPGGVADRDGRLRSGDMLLRIGAVPVVGMCARQAAAVLRQCGACVRLLVARPACSGALPPNMQPLGTSPAPIVPSRLLADPMELERRLAEAGHDGFGALCEDTSPASPPPTIIEESLHHRPVASMVAVVPRGALAPAPRPPCMPPAPRPQPPPLRLPLDMAVRGTGEPETLSYEVELNKDSALGLGITVAGYVCEQEELSGIFVKSISEGSSADLCAKIQVNDRIVEVDGVSLRGVTNHRAVGLLRDARGPLVRLRALRYLRGAGFERLQKALAAQDGRRSPVAPPSPSVTSLAKYSFSVYDESTVIEVEPESEAPPHLPSPTSPSEEAEIVIGRDDDISEREVRRIQDKWRDTLRDEPEWPGHRYQYDIIVGTIMKDKESGLGISLEGTVRVVGGKEMQARHFIRAVAPDSPVARLGMYQVGDELLEVNGWRVLGAHHVDVVRRLRAVTSPVLLVCVRQRQETIDNKPKLSLTRSNMLGGSLQDLLVPPQRLIKAKSESSVASLCSATTVLSCGHDHDEFCSEDLERNRSRSLEPLSGLAMWSDQIEYIQLVKEDRGLGFSILDYLDPLEAGGSVIVVRSVVRGGAAAREGRLAPGDRLVSVNGQDVARSSLAHAVRAIKSAPKGIVTIGIAKPLPCSTVVGGESEHGHSARSSQECINSLASDDQTGMDSFHECLQEYGEGLEVVQICLEPEDASIKDDELSALADLSFDYFKKKDKIIKDDVTIETEIKVNGLTEFKSSKSYESLDEHDDDMTITEDDILITPRELPETRSKSADRKNEGNRCLSKQQSKDISTSDEIMFAVTPTGLERISFDKYWAQCDDKIDNKTLEEVKSDESWKECIISPTDELASFYDTTTRIMVQEKNNSLLYIDHEVDGYETCLDEDSSLQKWPVKNDRKMNGDTEIKESSKHEKIASKHKDNDVSTKIVKSKHFVDCASVEETYSYPYVQEHIIKQMKSLRIEPLNVNISKKRKRSPTKPSKHERIQCIEYYNDQAECLKEIQKKIEEDKKKHQEEQTKTLQNNIAVMSKKLKLQQQPSEESTDLESNYVPGCHKCFLENYAYAITQAYMAEANACKYCDVIREMLDVPKDKRNRRGSAPALVNLDSGCSDSDEEDLLAVPVVKDRRKSAGPLKFPVSSRRPSYGHFPTMTVSTERRGGPPQRWGAPRRVTLQRSPPAPLGVSIVGGKVDIISNRDSDDGEEKAMFGIFIKNVVAGSPAGNSGELQTGDRILEVDGVCVRSAQHEEAVQLIKAAGDTVTLTVQSLLAWNTDSSDVEASSSPTLSTRKSPAPLPPPPRTPQHDIKITVTSEPDIEKESEETEKEVEKESDLANQEPRKTEYSDSESSDEEDERELQGRTYSEKGVEIDRASAGAVKRTKEEKEADREEEDDFGYTTNKIRKKYAGLGDNVLAVRLERSPRAGLGLSLAGHRDRSRMAVFVCGLNPAGSAARASPPVKVGDEILEVNGIVLHGRCHLNASAIIKGLVGPVFKIILLRRKSALEDVAVKPLSQFPTAFEEESEDRFAGYKGVRDITIKKGPSGLGIMIIEGRHTEAGRGIFVSDLQEGSVAEQAGLQIGDMLLAVNRDSLLNCGYDAAAAKLKQTEGVVVLTICTPNLKEPGDKTEDPSAAPKATDQTVSLPVSHAQPMIATAAEPRAVSPKPGPSPAKAEPPADPLTAPIVPNQDTVIEISVKRESLGVLLIGGSDTLISGAGAIILDIYKTGVFAKDGRLKVGDQILECNGVAITKEMAHERRCLTIKQRVDKLKLTVHRPEPVKFDEVAVELVKKSGKSFGFSCASPESGTSVYISEVFAGTPAGLDGRLQKGDFLTAVDDKDVSTANFIGLAATIKSCGSKANFKVKRFKSVRTMRPRGNWLEHGF